jgi:hypothetical protein
MQAVFSATAFAPSSFDSLSPASLWKVFMELLRRDLTLIGEFLFGELPNRIIVD